MNRGTKFIARTGIIAALYFILTFAVAPIAYGPLQFRIGEALTLLPLLFPEAILGLTIGCLGANILSPFSWADVVFGTLATLVAGCMTYFVGWYFRKKGKKTEVMDQQVINKEKDKKMFFQCLLGSIPPIFVNAIALPLMWLILGSDSAYWLNFGMLVGTQTATVLVLGTPLTLALSRTKI
ncbi:MAG: QueT transporter family protein [Clostridia bacterium]|jgi:uncharacterized membrane protein|nr:QueT transporter family protein [Clostridia bacterium]